MLTENIVSDQDVFDYLGIDDSDDPMIIRRVGRLRKAAASFLNESVGKHLDDKNALAGEVALAVIGDFYDNRCTTQRVTVQTRKMIRDVSQVLVLEGRINALRQKDPDPEAES